MKKSNLIFLSLLILLFYADSFCSAEYLCTPPSPNLEYAVEIYGSVSPPTQTVAVGEPITITIRGKDCNGLNRIGQSYQGSWHWVNVSGAETERQWVITESAPGFYTYQAQVVGKYFNGWLEEYSQIISLNVLVTSSPSPPDDGVCIDDCVFVGGIRCVDGYNKQTCGNYDDDDCWEWSPSQPCGTDTSCGYGTCSDLEKPTWRCSQMGDVAECYYDCSYDALCSTPSEGECSILNDTKCFDNTKYQICGNYDSDPELEWGDPITCTGNASCGYGTCTDSEKPIWYCSGKSCTYNCTNDPSCVITCQNECVATEIRCSDETHKQTCGNYDSDECLEWSAPILCTGDTSCGYGRCGCGPDCFTGLRPRWLCDSGTCLYSCYYDTTCAPSCENECSTIGATRCSGNNRQTCGNYDADSCLEWGNTTACTGDTSCGYGTCNDSQRPSWYCSGSSCAYTCVDDSTCNESCSSECSSGQTRCSDDGHRQVCGNYDSDTCLEWSLPDLCAGDTYCGYGTCSDSQKPQWYCSSGACYYRCVSDSTCGTLCVNECSQSGILRCLGSNKQTCGNYDADSCLEWGNTISCVGDTSCGYGNCSDSQKPSWYCLGGSCLYNCVEDSTCAFPPSSCVSECSPSGQTRCSGNNKQTCGNYDTDSCLEWGANQACTGDISCGYGVCPDSQRPSWYCFNGTCSYNCVSDSSCVAKKGGDSSDYCQKQNHCGDGMCNCGENNNSCPNDCGSLSLNILLYGKREQDPLEWKKDIGLGLREKVDILLSVLNNTTEDFDNVIVKADIPKEIIYKGELKIGDSQIEGDITEGINIGFLSANSEKRITFKGEVSPNAVLNTKIELIGSARVADFLSSDSMNVAIEEMKKDEGVWGFIKKWYYLLILILLVLAFLFYQLFKKSE
ncbi:MAG: hypothetical protein PHI53_02040 [Candidatus Pacebacteria bacterium]|nr:hypothetical protein [Candidatus Paceibacterota bacterium]